MQPRVADSSLARSLRSARHGAGRRNHPRRVGVRAGVGADRARAAIWAVLLAWSVSGVLTLFGALACAELASAFPRTGGVYVFLKETYSPVAGFLWGWAMFWVMHSGIIAAMATVFGRYAGVLRPARRPRHPRRRGGGDSRHLGAQLRRRQARQHSADRLHDRARSLAVALIVVVGFVVGSRLPDHFQQGAATQRSRCIRTIFCSR